MNLHVQFRKPLDDGLKLYHVWSFQVGILWLPSKTEGQYVTPWTVTPSSQYPSMLVLSP